MSSNDEVKVSITCRNESRIAGEIDVPIETGKKGFLLSSRVVWAGFRPVTEEYRLPRKMQGDGQVLRCSRCQGMLCIEGETKTKEAETEKVVQAREEARQRILSEAQMDGEVHQHLPSPGIDPGLIPITLGKTRIKAQ